MLPNTGDSDLMFSLDTFIMGVSVPSARGGKILKSPKKISTKTPLLLNICLFLLHCSCCQFRYCKLLLKKKKKVSTLKKLKNVRVTTCLVPFPCLPMPCFKSSNLETIYLHRICNKITCNMICKRVRLYCRILLRQCKTYESKSTLHPLSFTIFSAFCLHAKSPYTFNIY